jgi:hypothetical protein
MNLNENPRIENLDITDCATLYNFISSIVDGIFSEEQVGDWTTKKVPKLENIEETQLFGGVDMTRGKVTMGAAGI